MPGQGKYTQYKPNNLGRVLGDANYSLLGKLFNTPTYNTSQTEILAAGNNLLFAKATGGHQDGDPNMLPEGVSMAFAGSPDITQVATGGGGLPSTPWSPNLKSPGEGNGDDASQVTAMDIDPLKPYEINPGFQQDVNGLNNPAKESDTMYSATRLAPDGVLTLGAHPGGQEFKINRS